MPPWLSKTVRAIFTADRVRGWQWLALAVAVVSYLWLHFFLAGNLIRQTNLDMHATDQRAYLQNAWNARGDALPGRTDAVRNSLWQWLVVHTWLEKKMGDIRQPIDEALLEPHFVAGKWFNVWTSAGFLAVFAFACGRFFPLVTALNLLVLAGIAVLLPRSVWFQAESLYFMLFFACWLCCWRLLIRNPTWLYAVLSVLAGLAYLAKPSTSPLLAVFILMSAVRFVGAFRPGWLGLGEEAARRWSWQRHLAGLAVFVLCFGLLIAPRAVYASKVYNDPFISLPGYWMWTDDWEKEAIPLTINSNFGADLHKWPKSELPSFGKWIREHGWGAFWQRLSKGTAAKMKSFLSPDKIFWRWSLPKKFDPRVLPDRGVYLGIPLALLAGLGVVGIRRRAAVGARGEVAVVALFGIGAFSIYTLAYGWYDPIGRGDRFMMTLYLPALFMLMWACERMKRRLGAPAAFWAYGAAQAFILICLVTRCVQFVIRPVFG